MDTIKAANKIIKEGIALLPDEAKNDFKAQASDIFIDEAISNACGAVNESEEKIALLKAYAVQEANRVVTTLWRLELLPKDMEKEYRKLPPMTDTAAEYNKFMDDRKSRMDNVLAAHRAISGEEKELDIFKGIVNGMDKKESERKYAEYQQQAQKAMAGGR